MTKSRKHVREELLSLRQLLAAEYDGVEGYLGESFCEDELGMCKVPRGTKDVDGYIGEKSVQVKFKWIDESNFNTRYVSIPRDPEFDLLIVTYARPEDMDVRFLGIWSKEDVLSVTKFPRNKVSSSGRADLKNLRKLPLAEQGLPFEMRTPNRLTVETLTKSELGEDLHRSKDAETLFNDLNI